MRFNSPLLLLASLSPTLPTILGQKDDVAIESFEKGKKPSHFWYSLNDPVMGGQSTGTFVVSSDDGVGVFEGSVKNVPSLGAPGFIAARTQQGGRFPDLRSCDGLRLRVRSETAYGGYRFSFGTDHAPGNMVYARGYKARFIVPDGSTEFHDILMKFTDFSDNWDAGTGDIVVSCAENEQFCPSQQTLQDMKQMEIMAEGVGGDIKLEIQSITATNCDDVLSVTDPDSEGMAQRDSSGGDNMGTVGGPGQFGNNNWSGQLDRDNTGQLDREKNAVGRKAIQDVKVTLVALFTLVKALG